MIKAALNAECVLFNDAKAGEISPGSMAGRIKMLVQIISRDDATVLKFIRAKIAPSLDALDTLDTLLLRFEGPLPPIRVPDALPQSKRVAFFRICYLIRVTPLSVATVSLPCD
jgi:hypothetical protein